MALDPRRAPPKTTPRHQRPRSCVWWFLFGLILGSFGVGLYWMTQAPGQLPGAFSALPKVERPAPAKPSFQYEKLLKETVVDTKDTGKPPPPPAARPEPPPPPAATAEPPIPEAKPGTPDAAKAKADAAVKAKAEAAAGGAYVLQVGSFKSPKEADAAKAKLAMSGTAARVSTFTKDGQTWYRVSTGRLEGKKAMESARAALKKHGTEGVPVKVK